MTNMATPKHNYPFPGSHRIYNFGVLLLGFYCYIYALCLSDPCPGVQKTNLKEIIYILTDDLAQQPLTREWFNLLFW